MPNMSLSFKIFTLIRGHASGVFVVFCHLYRFLRLQRITLFKYYMFVIPTTNVFKTKQLYIAFLGHFSWNWIMFLFCFPHRSTDQNSLILFIFERCTTLRCFALDNRPDVCAMFHDDLYS